MEEEGGRKGWRNGEEEGNGGSGGKKGMEEWGRSRGSRNGMEEDDGGERGRRGERLATEVRRLSSLSRQQMSRRRPRYANTSQPGKLKLLPASA